MAAAAGIISLVAGGVSAAQSINQGQIAGAQARNQAALTDYQAAEVGRAGVADQNRYRRELAKVLGRQRAIIGANGLQPGGSPVDVMEDTAATGEEDIANIRHQASLDAYGLRVGAADTRYQGSAARRAANGNAFSSLVQGVGGAYGSGIGSKIGAGLGSAYRRVRGAGAIKSLDSPILTGSRNFQGYA